MFLSDMSWPQVDALSRDIVVVCTIGALEQHGPHLPLGTDHLVGEAITKRVEARMSDRVLCLPTIWFGCSDHHMSFAGTVSLSGQTMQAILHDTASSLIRHGFQKFIFLNSHGGNRAMLAYSIQQLGAEFPNTVFVGATYWDIAKEELENLRESGFGGMGHACELETSILMRVVPSLVDMSKAEQDGQIAASRFSRSEMLHGAMVSVYRPFSAVSRNGVFGDPVCANAEKGEQFLSAIADAVEALCRDVYDGRI